MFKDLHVASFLKKYRIHLSSFNFSSLMSPVSRSSRSSGIRLMGKKNQSNPVSLPLPKWASFQNDTDDPSRDFPAGPYNRMVAKLYGISGQCMANSSIRFYPVGVRPSLSIDEPRQEAVATSLYSQGKLTHNADETRQDNASVRFYSVGLQSKYSIDDAIQEAAATRLHSGGQHIQSLEGIRRDDAYAGFYPAGVLPTGGEGKEDETTRLYSGGDLILRVDETKLGAGSVRFYPVGVEYANGARQGAASTGLLSEGGQLAHGVDGRSEKDASSRFNPAGVHSADGTRQTHDPARVHLAGSEPKHLVDERKPDIVLERKRRVHGQPADLVHQEKMGNAPTKVVVHEEKLDKVPGGSSVERRDKANVDNAPSGVIFMCNKKTRTICFQYSLFGLPVAHSKLVQRIVPQTKLFLFVLDTRELHGVFEAASNGALNIEPRAFGGLFPSQVRFRICRECKPLAERQFKKAIEANYFQRNKFSPELTAQQVADLLQMFCPGECLEKKVETHETRLPDPTNVLGMMDRAASEPAECQSELSMEISPQNSPAVDSFQRSLCAPFTESQRGAQPCVMEASREISHVQGVRGQASMEDLIVGGQGVQPVPMERLRSYYSPSVERSILNKPHYMDVREDLKTPLTEDPMLVQSVGFQKKTESYLREASRQGHHSMVDQSASVHNNVDMRLHAHANHSEKTLVEGGDNMRAEGRDYLTSSRFEDSSYTLEMSNNGLRGSLHPSSAYSTGLQSRATGGQGQISSDLIAEQARLQFKESLQDSVPLASNTSILPWATGIPDQRFSDADVQRAIFHPQDLVQHHISNSGLQSWSSGLQGQKLSHVDVERGNLSSWATMIGNTHQMAQNRLLYEMGHSNLAEGKVHINELEVGRQQGHEHLERALRMFEKEVQESMNPRGEELDCSVSRFTERDKEQEDEEGKPIAHSLPGRPADASSFQMYKRMSEDPAGSTSNSYPWKRQACYTEPYEDKMAEGRFSFVDEAASSVGLRVNASHAGNNIDESNSRQLFSNALSLHDPQELGRSFGSQPSQASGLLPLPIPMARSTFPIERY